jgi:glycosyltransferase involved in cell wall biosynthesis
MSEPIPILFTIPNFINAGSAWSRMLKIIERLDRSWLAPSICVMKKGGELDREVERQGIPLLEAPFTVPPRPYASLWRRARQAARPFREGRYQLWHSFHYLDDYTEPIIARMAGVRAWVYTKRNMNWGGRAWYVRTLLATRVMAQNTDMLRDFFAPMVFARKARLVPTSVNTQLFHPAIPPRLNLRQQLNLSPGVVMAGIVAHLVPVKGHITLLRALARTPELHLVIVGKPMDREYSASLRDLVQTLGIGDRTHFLGEVKDVPGLLAELDIFVLPTLKRGEGCPVALLEAMSCGRACIVTDVSGSRDVVQNEKCGLIVRPEDVEALAAALCRLVSSKEMRGALGTLARERVLQNYTVEKEAAALKAIYEEILGPRRRA